MVVQSVEQTQRDPASAKPPASDPGRPVSEAFDTAVAQANKASTANPAAPPAPSTTTADARSRPKPTSPKPTSVKSAPAERPAAQPSNGATPSLAEQRR